MVLTLPPPEAMPGNPYRAVQDMVDGSLAYASPAAVPVALPPGGVQFGAEAKRALFAIDADVTFLNHGSYGACPRPILDVQRAYQDMMEKQPVAFFHDVGPRIVDVVRRVAAYVNADAPGQIALTSNATSATACVLRSLPFNASSVIVSLDLGYNAVRNAISEIVDRTGARHHVAATRAPYTSQAIAAAVEQAIASYDRVDLVVVDHITSATALVLPVHV